MQYFKGQGYAFEPTVNPADRILDIITKSDDSLYEKWQTNIKRQSEQQAGLGGGAAMPVNGQGNFGFWNPRPVSGNVCFFVLSWHCFIFLLCLTFMSAMP